MVWNRLAMVDFADTPLGQNWTEKAKLKPGAGLEGKEKESSKKSKRTKKPDSASKSESMVCLAILRHSCIRSMNV